MARTGFKPLNQASAEAGSEGTTRNEVIWQEPAWNTAAYISFSAFDYRDCS